MSTIFNNLDADGLTPLAKNDGWESCGQYDNAKINRIKDTIVNGGIGYYKLGTSIPTPFARIFMFRNAFNRMTDMNDTKSLYAKLVSECLDFLEFVFHFGQEIEVKKWSFNDDINLLRGVAQTAAPTSSVGTGGLDDIFRGGGVATPAAATDQPVNGHVLLADCLFNMRDELGLPNAAGKIVPIDNIYLLYYHGILVGGTSPFTLLFTSPNWQRHKNCGQVLGNAGNELFPDYQLNDVQATPLHMRDSGFIQYLLTYYCAYSAGVQNQSLFEYINRDIPHITKRYPEMQSAIAKLQALPPAQVAAWFAQQYPSLTCNRAPVFAHDNGVGSTLPIAYYQGDTRDGSIAESDYIIQTPKEEGFEIRDANGEMHLIRNVLVLSQAGLETVGGEPAKYIGGHPWNKDQYGVDHNIVNVDLWDRILPGPGNHNSPFITVYDLFEDYIIRVPYSISKSFETYVNRNWNYLLPLKKMFFNFFDADFLADPGLFSIKEEDGEVLFELKIPVKYNPGHAGIQQYLTLHKSYDNEHVRELRGSSMFALAVFPSYRIMGDETDNDYTLMAANGELYVDMEFYTTKDVQNPIQATCIPRPDEIKSRFYRVNTAFDFIQVSPDFKDVGVPVHALIIPKFSPAYIDKAGTSSWKFGIDFGTSNTYIAATNKAVPGTFEIQENESQIMYLDQFDKTAPFGSEQYLRSVMDTNVMPFHNAANRAFVPTTIGPKGIARYPFQTVTCEAPNFGDVLQADASLRDPLFSKIAIGYNINHETFNQNYIYRTDLKWAAEKAKDQERLLAVKRVQLYCQQIAWMLKNKVALSSDSAAHQSQNFNVYYTYPCSMGATEIDDLDQAWREAFGPNVTIERMTESEAPYYYLTHDGTLSAGRNFLNIDIGGGTTDMFFVIKDDGAEGKGYYTSMRFAGNDLWGDGVGSTALLTNGFYKYAKEKLGNQLDVSQMEELIYGNPNNTMTSADIMAFMFHHDTQGIIPTLIQSQKSTLYPLLIVHFGAIIYHVSMILKEKDWAIPQTINLTGMGSKYVQIISKSSSNITRLTGMLMKKFTGKDLPADFKLTFSAENAKEITAQGAIYKNLGRGKSTLNGDPKPFQVYGFPVENDAPIKYEKTKQSDVRNQILQQYNDFINAYLEDDDIRNELMQNFYNADITDWLIQGLRNKAEDSYLAVTELIQNDRAFVTETLFFWPLKNAIYELSKEIPSE